MANERMMEKIPAPTPEIIYSFIGAPLNDCWSALDRFVRETYAVEPELHFGKKYGWTQHYSKGGRPLCEITPERGGFIVLVVLGAKEGAQAVEQLDSFGPAVRSCLETAKVFHDGRWLFIRAQEQSDIEDIERLILMKRQPPKKKPAEA